MSFTLHQVDPSTDQQWPQMMSTMCLAFEQPLQPMFRLFRPPPDPVTGQESSLEDFSTRMRSGLGAGKESTWQKVLDSQGSVIGGALWKTYHSDPFAEPPTEDETVTWFPEGGARDFVAAALERLDEGRKRFGRRAHVFLNILWVDPKWQRRGVGKVMMDWGVKQAEELGVEMWLDASPYGKGLYEQYGFTGILNVNLSPPQEPPNEEWALLKRELGDMDGVVMWRPRDGPYVPGKSSKPWEETKAE